VLALTEASADDIKRHVSGRSPMAGDYSGKAEVQPQASTRLQKNPVMTTERFLNTYHNASTAPSPDVPADLASFMLAADPVLAEAAELARVLARAPQFGKPERRPVGWASVPE
jgi:hypothetical protein